MTQTEKRAAGAMIATAYVAICLLAAIPFLWGYIGAVFGLAAAGVIHVWFFMYNANDGDEDDDGEDEEGGGGGNDRLPPMTPWWPSGIVDDRERETV
jgi:hypothetical protein